MEMYSLKTAEDIYKAFLHKITRERSTEVNPEKFNRYINLAQIEWVKNKLPLHQFDQKRIDDLQILHVVTDDIDYQAIPAKGTEGMTACMFGYPTPGNNIIADLHYPALMHGIAAMFQINYKASLCNADGVSDWVKATYLKSDAYSFSMSNVYTRPQDDRLYFQIIGNKVKLLTGLSSGISKTTGKLMRLEYYRYPGEIVYSVVEGQSRSSEFNTTQNAEIVNIAVTSFLERSEDKRLVSFVQTDRSKEQ